MRWLALCLVLLAASPALAETVVLADRRLSLTAPGDYCTLDRDHPVDSQIIAQVEGPQAGLNHVALQFAFCSELDELRSGRRSAFDHFGAIMMPLEGGVVRPATGMTRSQLIAGMKTAMPAFGPEQVQQIVDLLNARIVGRSIQGFEILGPVFEDGNGLYIAMIGTMRIDGEETTFAGMWVSTMLSSVVTNIYLYQPTGQGAFDSLLLRIRPLAAELVRRNP